MNAHYLAIAERIGARLCRDALWSGGLCNWTGDYLDDENQIAHGALGPTLYAGTAGIALFLGRLDSAAGDRIFRRTAEAALSHALAHLPVEDRGLFTGRAGIRYVEALLRGQADAAAITSEAVPNPAELDVIAGAAGTLAVLVHLHKRFGDMRFLDAAILHGDLLIGEAHRSESGWSWTTLPGAQNLTGFSHGTSGIASALLELFAATRETRFRDGALNAFQYERSCFNSSERNWPDYRRDPPDFPVLWCHGATGIGFSRLRAWQILRDEKLLEEAHVALDTVSKSIGKLESYSLCHGELGNADLLLYAAELLGEDRHLRSARHVADAAYERFERRRIPWPASLTGGNQTPDLMTGLAGVGYFYLRLAAPEKIPSVLILPTGTCTL